VLELAGAGLGYFDVGDKGKNDVGWVPLLEMSLNTKGICGVDQDTCVLGRDHGFDHGGQIVDIGQGLHAKDDIVVGILARGGVFGGTNN
jgi:hypothetical protein